MEKVETFWKWFQDHNEQLVAMGDLEDKERMELENALQYQLTKYCAGLSYEIGDATANGRTLTFTTEGDTDLFRYVVELVDNAPDLDWWEFVAFKQPMGTELKVRFDKMVFDTRKMYFEQLECEVGVYVTLEALMGEFDCATLIGYMETVPVPEEPFKSGFQKLDDLPKFVDWFKAKRDA